MLNKNFILHLTLIEGIGPSIIQKIIERSDVNASDLYLFTTMDWMQTFGFAEKIVSKIVAGLSDVEVLEKELNLVEQHKIKWMTITDEMYPALLKEIYLPPMVLYFYTRDMSIFKDKCLAVVGSRKANEYGQRIINTIVPDLVAAGYTIVSGGALGIDTMAHEAALQCGGKTIAILGSGLLKPYPSQNKSLFKNIIESGGAIISSFPLKMQPLQYNFPARNRIVTGLSRGCLVVQAAQKSGALISAHYAMEQGREVFAVPGAIGDELSAGCNELIQQGAKLVSNSSDILQEFGERVVLRDLRSLGEVSTKRAVAEQRALQMSIDLVDEQRILPISAHSESSPLVFPVSRSAYSETQKQILHACKNAATFDDIMFATQLNADVVQAELFNLQLEGVLSQNFIGMWNFLD